MQTEHIITTRTDHRGFIQWLHMTGEVAAGYSTCKKKTSLPFTFTSMDLLPRKFHSPVSPRQSQDSIESLFDWVTVHHHGLLAAKWLQRF